MMSSRSATQTSTPACVCSEILASLLWLDTYTVRYARLSITGAFSCDLSKHFSAAIKQGVRHSCAEK